MAKKATIYAVASHCGVSTATVSRIMSDESFGSARTRQRVLSAAVELGWVPNGAARSLASRKAGIIGVLFPDLGQSGSVEDESPLYVDEVIRGAERAATLAGQAVLIAATRAAAGRDLAFSVAGKVDGLAIMARSLSSKDIAALSRSLPIVLLANMPARGKLDYVTVDNRGGIRQMTSHLIDVHRHNELAFVGGPAGSPDSAERYKGFCEALELAGIAIPERPDAEGGFTEAGGAEATRALLRTGRRLQAIVYGNDEMALGGIRVIRDARLRVPGDIAVTGFDDIASARHVRPALTTVRQPMRELGGQAVEVLLSRMNERGSPRLALVLPVEAVIRNSCGCRLRSYGIYREDRDDRDDQRHHRSARLGTVDSSTIGRSGAGRTSSTAERVTGKARGRSRPSQLGSGSWLCRLSY